MFGDDGHIPRSILQDIKTAPKDGTRIIGFGRHKIDSKYAAEVGFCETYWHELDGWWVNLMFERSDLVAWMPCPDIEDPFIYK